MKLDKINQTTQMWEYMEHLTRFTWFRPNRLTAGAMFSTLKMKLSYQNRGTLVSTFIFVTIHQ